MGVQAGNVGLAMGLSAAAGACTLLGGALVFFVRASNHRFLSVSLGLAAGVMVYVSFVEIFCVKAVTSFEEAGMTHEAATRYGTLGFFGGAALTWLLDKVADRLVDFSEQLERQRRRRTAESGSESGCQDTVVVVSDPGAPHIRAAAAAAADRAARPRAAPAGGAPAAAQPGPKDAAAPPPAALLLDASLAGPCGDEACSAAQLCAACRGVAGGEGPHADVMDILTSDPKLSKLGVLAALAVGMHNLPEGVATFIATMASPALGLVIVVAIALHNIPEGICIAMPTYYSTGSRWRAVLMCAIAGMAEPVGALVGWAVLSRAGATPLPLAVMFSIVAGMMVYISLVELLPAALKYDPSTRLAACGLYSGMAIMAISLLLFKA
ncbi:zinc transporter [Raphidocelis subcapitata]|uniref:Zinc transporter n=1 Tax=Raphidocelis subcapitata TaxID=307507 RepID=A0A2V0P767_9CHLO|nr:zinc transporter [Raphidocelis subcapitata]|eukprot:GBF93037.1 zinc transporter [Raphidocelis subcapitata]